MIRHANHHDIDAIMAIDAAVLKTNWQAKLYLESMVLKDTEFYVYEEDAQVKGFLMYRNIGGDFEIIQIAIVQEKHHQGIGTNLIEMMIHEAIKSDVEYIYLEVHFENAQAYNFYKRFGFTKIHTRKNYYGPNEDAYVMRKDLKL